jgi:hypothetical protein
MDSKRAIMAADFLPFSELAEEWAAELGVPTAWLRRELTLALQDGLLEPSPEAPPALALRDNLALRLKKVSWSDFSVVAEARVPDIAPQLKAEGKQFDLVDVGEIAHEATLMISRDLVQRMGTENPKLVPAHVWYDEHWPELATWCRPSSAAGPADAEKRDAPPEDAEVHEFLNAHPEWTQTAARIECRKRWPGLRERPQWRRICEQRTWKLGRPPGK